jgi:hypothetical protein
MARAELWSMKSPFLRVLPVLGTLLFAANTKAQTINFPIVVPLQHDMYRTQIFCSADLHRHHPHHRSQEPSFPYKPGGRNAPRYRGDDHAAQHSEQPPAPPDEVRPLYHLGQLGPERRQLE